MDKTLKYAAGAAALAATMGVSANAQADTMTEQTEGNSTVVEKTQVTDITAEQVQNAKDQAVQAKTDEAIAASQAGQDYNANQEAVQSVQEAQDALTQAQERASEATPENIENAKNNVTVTEQAVKTANETLTTVEAEHQKAETEQKQAQDAVTQAHAQTQSAIADVKSAETEVEEARTNLAGSVTHDQAEANVQEAEQTVQDKKDSVSQATNELTNAKNANDQDNSKVAELQKTLSEVEAQHTNALTEIDKVQSEVNSAKAKVEALKEHSLGTDHIATTPEWISAMKNLLDMKTGKVPFNQAKFNELMARVAEQDADAVAAQKAYLKEVYADTIYNGYVQRTVNGETKIFTPSGKVWENTETPTLDPNNLPADVSAELNQHIAKLINSLREKLGLAPIYVNNNEVEFAKRVASEYRKDNHEDDSHYGKGINRVAQQLGLRTSAPVTQNSSQQYYENLGNDMSPENHKLYTKAELFAKVDTYMYEFFYEGYQNYGHALRLLTQDTFGAAYSQYGDMGNGYQYLKLHILDVPNHNMFERNGRSQDELKAEYAKLYGVDSPATVKSVNKDTELFAAQTALNAAEEKLINTKSTETRIAEHKGALEQDLATAQEDVKKSAELVVVKEKAVNEANAELTLAQNNLETAKQTLKSVDASQTDKQARLNNAEQALKQAEVRLVAAQNAETIANANLDGRNAVLTSSEVALTVAKSQVHNAEAAFTSAKDYLQSLLISHDILTKAQVNYDKAVKYQSETEKRYNASKQALEQARQKANDAETAYMTLYSQYQAQQATKPVDTEKPVEPAKPVDTEKPVEPAKPVDTEKPVEPAKPVDTEKPVEPAKPVDTEKPVEAAKPADTEKPVEHAKTVDTETSVTNIQATVVNTQRPNVDADVETFSKPLSRVEKNLPETGDVPSALGLLGTAFAALGFGVSRKRKED